MARWIPVALVFGVLCLGVPAPADAGPNVLFFAVDDLRPELGCYGHPIIKSPNIDRLAKSGLVFDRAYCQQAVCAPSRASLLSGLRPDSTTIYDLNHPLRKTKPKVRTLPQHFLEAGYETISLGKIYHHHTDDNGIGWSQPAWHPEQGVDGKWKGRGYLTPEAQAKIDTGTRKGAGVGPAYECADVDDDAYPDGAVAKKAIAELRRLKGGSKPFFLAVGFVKPHLPFNSPKRYWDLYDHDAMPVSPQVEWPRDMPPFAGTSWGEMRGYVDISSSAKRLSPDLSRTLIQGYYACVSYTDQLVGNVLDELDRLKLRDNTIVILWGDHGWKLSEYSAWCKHTNFELDTHVPMILRVPGKAPGQRTQANVEYVDIYPTLADLCGLPIPEHCEGTSMAPLLDDPARPWKDAAFSQYPRGALMGYTMRCGQWRYTEWINRKTKAVEARELYDHATSPVAAVNLAGDAKYADTVNRLANVLDHGKGWKALQAVR